MKKIIYTNISRNKDTQLGRLIEVMSGFRDEKFYHTFLMTELRSRIDEVLWSEVSACEKVGAIKQLLEMTDLLNCAGASQISQTVEKAKHRSKKSKKTSNKFNKITEELGG